MQPEKTPRPDWLKVKLPNSQDYFQLKKLVEQHELHTVCRDARCPNIGECWSAGTATFMILGNVCTRQCRFCAVKSGAPQPLHPEDPGRVAAAVAQLHLRYAVITSVSRDDLFDGGAGVFADTIHQIRGKSPGVRIEVLIPDFQGMRTALHRVVAAAPDVLAHNVETVARLYSRARPDADYLRSLDLLRSAKSFGIAIKTKSSLMLGLGETDDEICRVLGDLRAVDVDFLTLGQYLQPEHEAIPVDRYYTPEEFVRWRDVALQQGFLHVASGPLVRSSYRAHRAMDVSSTHGGIR